MMPSTKFSNPFPGLRPFKTEEYRLFFGREGQADQLINRLQQSRLLAVVGTSGSGKSSLIQAGLLPAVQGGMMSGTGSGWRIAVMRPGGDPIGNLARELARKEVLPEAGAGLSEEETSAVIEATLRGGSLGIVDLIRQGRLDADQRLLIVVDQFEELFRFRAEREKTTNADEAAAFVKLLLEVSQQREFHVYIVLTMRSDFLGDCAQFQGLPEAINDGQYLIPRMSRDERRVAVTGPIGVTRSKITEPLVNRLLNDVGDNPDQLPILQHALMRTWRHWDSHRRNGEAIGIEDYEAIGTMSEALSLHADEAFNELPDDRSRKIAEKLFKALTERGPDNREIRHPMRLSSICDIADASIEEVIAVIDVFRSGGRSFLMPPSDVSLQRDTIIDISHESLIRNWQRLRTWVNEEAQSARTYRRLAEAAVLHFQKMEGLLQDPWLQIAIDWYEESHANAYWAERYHPSFLLAIGYLEASRAERGARIAAAEAEHQKQIERERREVELARRFADEQARSARNLKRLSMALVILSVLAFGALGYAVYAYAMAKKSAERLQTAKTTAENATKSALAAQADAEEQKKTADIQKNRAEEQKRIADNNAQLADDAKKKALAEKARADQQARISAQHAKEERIAKDQAKEEQKKAEDAKAEADEQRKIAYQKLKEADEAKEAVIAEQRKTASVQKANELFRQGSANSKRGKAGRDSAIKNFSDAVIAFKEIPDKLAVAATQVEMFEVFLASDEPEYVETAPDFLEAAVALYEEEKEYNSAAFVAVRFADFLADPKNATKVREIDDSLIPKRVALEALDAAKDFYQKANNKEGQITVLTRMGDLAEETAEHGARDTDFYEKTLPLFDTTRDRDKLSQMYIKIGRAYAKREQEVNRATEYFERAIKLYQDAGDPVAVTDTLLGLAFDARGRSPNAAALADMNAYVARAEALWPNDTKPKSDALRKIGERYLDICWRGGVSNSRICEFAVPKAIEYGERAHSLYKQLNDPAGQAISIANIAEVYVAWGVPPKGFTLASIGGAAALAKQPWRNRKSRDEAARLLYLEALDLFRQTGIKSKEMAETLENLAKLSDGTPPFTEKRNYYEEAGVIYNDLKDRRSLRRIASAIKALDKPTEQPKPTPTPPNTSP